MNYTVKILDKTWLTHNVMQLEFEKPKGFSHTIGQAVELTLNQPEFKTKFAPFTLVSEPGEAHLKLIIKVYLDHHGLTQALSKAKISDTLIITEAWDSYDYKGKGTFIAAGSGITPFIPMFRNLQQNDQLENHTLIYANRTQNDIIIKEELTQQFKKQFYNILSDEQVAPYDYGKIDQTYLATKIPAFDVHFYVCGPDGFMQSVKKALIRNGAREENIQTGY
ncbi:Phthalate 4,5-dioxygenase oxygenase reductase subunit [Arenibacter antarcticus]|uniref:Flavodoxin reductase n=1 Tax=Arenibacter antarcticus TaxID=2040469 RepID=A0ABW5VG81_9FLAO|nr:flavodoxin reductase [Arenibacter sp. H213]MCM4167205.1 flavodoxin reductase [Arenibacter sp. H213]